jgi:hypothetical protein
MKAVATRSSTRAIANAEARQRAEQDRGGTPETIAKARVTPCPIDTLLERGVIDDGQAKDMEAIHAGYQIITQGVSVKISSPFRVDHGERNETERQAVVSGRYRLWSVKLRMAGKLWAQKVCVWVAADGLSLADCDERLRKRKGTARGLLLDGLAMYREVKRTGGI